MLDIVRNKLRAIYDIYCGKMATIYDIFIDQFREENVDSDLMTFDQFIKAISAITFKDFIPNCNGSNEYGEYHLTKDEYAVAVTKPFLEYIPDLGILDYLLPSFKSVLGIPHNRFITVHFPKVRVTNEYDKFIDIQDLWARVEITPAGTMTTRGLELTRTTFPYEQFRAGYAHSHMRKIQFTSDIGYWSNPCMGTGPIRNTQYTLQQRYDEQIWGLFAYELSKYVTIESVTGTPYIRLESVGKGALADSYEHLNHQTFPTSFALYRNLIESFIIHYAQQMRFRFKYVDNQYKIGVDTTTIAVDLSNAFINYINNLATISARTPTTDELISNQVFKYFIVSEGKIYNLNNDRNILTANEVNGKTLFQFKGNPVKAQINIRKCKVENKSLLLNLNICEYIISKVLYIINYKYGKEKFNPAQTTGTPTKYYFI